MPNASESLLADLNPEQRRAASAGDAPLLIVAGAGTGKTTTLAHRVAHFIATGTHPSRVLLLTFSRRAAAEMLRRVESILAKLQGAPAAAVEIQRIWGGTFHAVASRLLRLHGRAVGLEPDFSIHDRADSEDLMNLLRADLGLAKQERRFPTKSACMAIYSRCVNARSRLDDVLEHTFPWCRHEAADLKKLFSAYVDRKQAQSILDYDDLLLFWHALLEEKGAGDAVRSRFDRVLVDEYQDTNALQAEILRGLRADGRGLTVVGDDAQAIYSFRAATVRNILDFPAQYAGSEVIKLETNYRSTPPLVAATNAVIAQAAERHEKELRARREGGGRPIVYTCRDEEEQTERVVATILDHREQGMALRRQAVLFRASHHSLALELELQRRNIPFHKYGGLKFIEAAHVKDLVAFLRLAENPRDTVSATRVLLLFPGVGPATARKLAEAGGVVEWERARPPSREAETWVEFTALVRLLLAPTPPPLASQVQRIRELWIKLAEGRYDDLAARIRDLEQLEHLAARYPDRGAFLAELALDPPSSTQDLAGPPHLDDDYLVLSTMHSAKGLEFDAVHVIHAADGNIPSDMATGSATEIEEELRLFYVALTRARDHLYVMFPIRYYKPGRFNDGHTYAQLTRFLSPEVLEKFERRNAVERVTAIDWNEVATGTATQADVRARVRNLWA